MSLSLLRRVTTVATAASLALMLLGTGIAQASTPGWHFRNVQFLPETVQPGGNAGYSFSITNEGTSNIAQVYLTTSFSGAPVYFSNSRGTVCQLSPSLSCAFGALNAGAHIDVLIAYAAPTTGSSFSGTFQLNGTGQTFSDRGGTSHGDTLNLFVSTNLNSSKNFGGQFVVSNGHTADNQSLGPKNIQATAVDTGDSLIPVTVEDGITTGVACTVAECSRTFGEWSRINVNNNHDYSGTAPFKVTILVLGNQVQGNPALTSFGIVHTRNDGTSYTITTQCDSATAPSNAECLLVTKVGNNYQIVVWLFQNGSLKGYT